MQDTNALFALYNSGRYGEAVACGEALLQRQPGSAVIYNTLGASYAQLRRPDKAAECYANALRAEPNNADAHNNLGIALVNLGRHDQAIDCFSRALKIEPRFAEAYNNLGFTLGARGRHDEAIGAFSEAIKLKPRYAEAHNNLGIALGRLGRRDEAIKSYGRALRLDPNNAAAHNNLGNLLWQSGEADEAIRSFNRALKINPNFADAHNNLGNTLVQRGRREEALESFRQALTLNPNFADALNNMGVALRELERRDEAIASFMRALKLKPDFADAYNNLGLTLAQLRRYDEAIGCYERALQVNPDLAEAHNNLGGVRSALGQIEAAIAAYSRALQINPDYAEAHNNLGLAFRKLGRSDEAGESFRRALALKPDFADAHHNLGVNLADLRRADEAIAAFTRALELDPNHALARAQRLYQQAVICDWAGIEADRHALPALGVTGGVVPPFSLLSLEDDPARHRIRAERFVAEMFRGTGVRPAPLPTRPDRLRIGYFSADFRNHAVMHLIAKVFETHDRTRFAVHAFSYGPETDDPVRARVKAGVDVFHDVRTMRDQEIADLARREGIDVAIDLSGHTQRTRSGLFAHRAAPVQINYLGYPGTIGAPFIDYIIADKMLIPEEKQAHYSEELIYLPNSYQANDNSRPISDRAVSRRDAGLPEGGFVFCSFNNNYKITAAEFDIWMGLLASVEGSVLWLLKVNASAAENLKREAAKRGIEPDRLVFAESAPLPEHLARHRLADLFLDTFKYNAHTTASDALWAGLPVVTKLGEGFAARVGGSLLSAVGLPELVTESEEAYAALALELATNPERLSSIRGKLVANRMSAPLFDSERFTRHLEAAYLQAYQRYFAGEAPGTIIVGA